MRYLLLVVFLGVALLSFSQERPSFELQRKAHFNSGEDYAHLEKEEVLNGRPIPALLHQRNETSISFSYYKSIPNEKKEITVQRLKQLFPFIQNIEYFGSNGMRVHWQGELPPNGLIEFLKVMGYEGYVE